GVPARGVVRGRARGGDGADRAAAGHHAAHDPHAAQPGQRRGTGRDALPAAVLPAEDPHLRGPRAGAAARRLPGAAPGVRRR
ncbi:unnamed protein product, partial [Heterosigma akashiwo]